MLAYYVKDLGLSLIGIWESVKNLLSRGSNLVRCIFLITLPTGKQD